MDKISKSVTKKDHTEKMNGRAIYIDDMAMDNMLYAKVLRSQKAHAKIVDIIIPPLDQGYYIVDSSSIKGVNGLKVITNEQPIFADDEVKFIGENILMIVGPDKHKVSEYLSSIEVIYEELPAVLSMDESVDSVAKYSYDHGNADEAFEQACYTFSESFDTGYQEQCYLEPQGAIGSYDGNTVTVYGTMQCPYYVKNAVAFTTGLDEDQVRIIQTTTGGAFGGKEDYPSMIGCMVAVAAIACNKPVKLIYGRREDMAVTPKRHPSRVNYQVALDENYKITAVKADILLDAGAYSGLSNVVLQRAIIAVGGVYKIPNSKVTGEAVITNTVPNGAFRGFGAPQTFFATEMLMEHIAKALDIDSQDLKLSNMVNQGDASITKGKFHHEVPMNKMIEEIEAISNYKYKRKLYATQKGRYRKGIGMSLFFHGCGFTGSAEKDYIKSVAKLLKHKDDRVEILVSNTDMGQGLKTTFSKIVAQVLQIPMDQIIVENPDTHRVPDSGPTVASRSLMIVGKLLERAATRLKEEWCSGEEQLIVEHYKHFERIPWDVNTFTGDAYPTYSWAVNVVEVETDIFTGNVTLQGAWAKYDIGTLIDETIARGQMEGGLLQAIGFGSMEQMVQEGGVIRQASMTDYIIPTSKDSMTFDVGFADSNYEDGPFGAKGAGELPLVGGAPAYALAVEQSINKPIMSIPITPEKIMTLLKKEGSSRDDKIQLKR